MLDIKPQPTPAAAFTQMTWAWAFAAARIADAFAARGAAWWSQMLRPAVERPARPVPPEPCPSPSPDEVACPADGPGASLQSLPAGLPAPADAAFASYRSDGGHATAQVIIASGTSAETAAETKPTHPAGDLSTGRGRAETVSP